MLQDIEDLSWQYLRMYPLKDFCWKNIQLLLMPLEYVGSLEIQKAIFSQTLHHPLALKFPPAMSYTRLFLKSLISTIEESNQEVCEKLYSAYTDLLSQHILCPGGFYYRTYRLSEGCSVSLKETNNLICDGTTGMCTWEASHVLARWCSKDAERFHKKNIVELGAGLGLMGITLVQTCKPASYTFTDLHESVLKTLTENIHNNLSNESHERAENNSAISTKCNDEGSGTQFKYQETDVKVVRLDWEEGTCDLEVDVILAADVVYDDEVTEHLVKVVKDICTRRPGVDIFVASTLRNTNTFAFFKDSLASHGLHINSESLHQYQESPSQLQHSIAILHIVS